MSAVRRRRDSTEMLTKKQVLVAFAAVLLAFAGASSASAASLSRTEASFLAAVNQTRAEYHLAPLHFDETLERAARAHSADMIRRHYFAHGAFAQRLRAFGARGPYVGENLAWGVGTYASPGNIVRQWLASPSHRANLLRPGYTRVGVGVLRGAFQGQAGALVITADFGGR
jgi:uncharacterized protein YkwD